MLSSLTGWWSEPSNGGEAAVWLLLVDCLISVATIQTVGHWDVDFTSYMQQAGNITHGQLNYSRLHGANGPLAYPAGHAWLYTAMYSITDGGLNTKLAQYISLAVYLLNVALVLRLLIRTERIPPYTLAILSIGATRVRSLTLLHLFNDPIAMFLLHGALNMFIDSHWSLGSLLFSLGVSIKMNILLFSPALLLVYLGCLGLKGTVKQLTICASVQLLTALPFLITAPLNYLRVSFNLNRSFLTRDSVNFAFLQRAMFKSSTFHKFLLLFHISLLLLCCSSWWRGLMARRRLKSLESKYKESVNSSQSCSDKWTAQLVVGVAAMIVPGILSLPPFHPLLVHILFWPTLAITLVLPICVLLITTKTKQLLSFEHPSQAKSATALKAEAILFPMFLCNFIGVVCCRTVHIQFYSWYFYSLPYLLSHTKLSTNFKLLLLGALELTYFSLEVNTVLGYWYNFGSNNWEYFEYWSKSACAPYISQKRSLDGFEVEIDEEVPIHCRRGCSISSLVWQTVHWTILVSVLVNMVKSRRRNYKNSQYG